MSIATWSSHTYGAATHGPIWTLATDGDAAYRLAKHQLCTISAVSPATALGLRMARLPGLNVYSGRDLLVATCDPKHVIKRFATLLRNPHGFVVNDTTLRKVDVFQALRDLPEMTTEKAAQLLDPADKQNVPKAVSLVQTLLSLEDLEKYPPTSPTPAHYHRRNMLSFTAEVMGYFVRPFISVDWDLSTQLRSLSTFAHLLAGMWIKHGSAFFTGALYYDSQSIVKNIVITIIRLQLIDDTLEYHIILEGTDRLERLFGDTRTQDHGRNFDTLQLSEKLSVAAIISSILERNPDLDRGHRRLNLQGATGVDHVNPKSWMGDVHVGNVAVDVEWAHGCEEANRLLGTYFGAAACIAFDSIFRDGDCDLMRPCGDYVGVRYDPDDARTEEEPIAPTSSGETDSDMDDEQSEAAAVSNGPVGVEIDDFLSCTPDGQPPTLADNRDDFLTIGDRSYLLSSVVTAFLTHGRSTKVALRVLRNAGVTLEDLRSADQWNSSELEPGDHVKVGDIAGTLVRSGDTIALAVLELTGFERENGSKKEQILSVPLEEFEERDSGIGVTAQILELSKAASADQHGEWFWPRTHVTFGETRQGRLTQKNLVLRVPGFFVHPLAPDLAPLPINQLHTVPSEANVQDEVSGSIKSACKLFVLTRTRYAGVVFSYLVAEAQRT